MKICILIECDDDRKLFEEVIEKVRTIVRTNTFKEFIVDANNKGISVTTSSSQQYQGPHTKMAKRLQQVTT